MAPMGRVSFGRAGAGQMYVIQRMLPMRGRLSGGGSVGVEVAAALGSGAGAEESAGAADAAAASVEAAAGRALGWGAATRAGPLSSMHAAANTENRSAAPVT